MEVGEGVGCMNKEEGKRKKAKKGKATKKGDVERARGEINRFPLVP